MVSWWLVIKINELFLLIENEDCHLVILMLLSCNSLDNQIYLQLSTNSHRIWLQVMSVARLNIFFNCSNWWWNFIIPEGFSCLYMSFWRNILYKYVSEILCFSEDYHQLLMYFLCTMQKEEDSTFVPIKGHILGYVYIRCI